MATLALDASASISGEATRAIVKEAAALNRKLGDPTKVAK
jgi:hypothetical protein